MAFDIELSCKELSSLSFSKKEKRYQKIYIEDSILSYFPSCRILIDDTEGLFSEKTGYIEGLSFDVRVSNPKTREFFQGSYWWSDNTLEISRGSSRYVNGIYEMYLTSSFKKQDSRKSKSYKGRFSDVASQIYEKYIFPSMPAKKNLYISQCDNNDVWFQSNDTDAEFIDRETHVCYSKSFPSSPFFSFFNMRSDFVFMPYMEMFTSQSPKRTFFLSQDFVDKDSTEYIRAYTADVTGATIKHNLYNMDTGYHDDSGAFIKKSTTLRDYILKVDNNSKSIVPIMENDLRLKRGNYQLGHFESSRLNNFRGKLNTRYIPFLTSNELTVKVNSALDICAGDIVNTKIDSVYSGSSANTLYSGKWLVLKHVMELTPYLPDEQPVSTLTLVKPTIPLDQLHPLYETFTKGK